MGQCIGTIGGYVLINQLEKEFATAEGLYSTITQEILNCSDDELLVKYTTENRKILLELTVNLALMLSALL